MEISPAMPIRVHFGLESLFGFLLTLTRVGSTLMLLPLPAFKEAVQMAKVVLVVAITFALMPVWPAVHFEVLSGAQFFLAILGETAIGLLLGLSIAMLHGSFQLAAQTISMQAGFSFASTFDPSSQADTTVFQLLAQLLTGLLFFILGIHGYLLRLIAHSFDVFPPGATINGGASIGVITTLATKMFITGFTLGLPVVALLVLVEIALAILSRLHAQLPLMTMTLSAKTILSFIFFAAVIVRWPAIYERTAIKMFQTLAQVGLK